MDVKAYNLLDRWLHWLALELEAIRHLSFELECLFALPQRPLPHSLSLNEIADPADGAVYVCGLARSGTTMLLRILDQIEIFRSLTYQDMPFVLAPNLWRQIMRYAPRKSVLSERAHGDGIVVDFDSPEGFEEVFWRTFGDVSLDSHCIKTNTPTPEVLAAFANYRALVANHRTEDSLANGILHRYLSKNNNNLMRLPSLCSDQTATVLLVYRNPIDTARSLHRQHQIFCAAQTSDRFTRRYMGWLVHHEFGLDHRPFEFAVPEMDSSLRPENLDYWLDYWNAVYQYVLRQNDLRVKLVNHDEICANPIKSLHAIFKVLGVDGDVAAIAQQIRGASDSSVRVDSIRTDLFERANSIYIRLLADARNIES